MFKKAMLSQKKIKHKNSAETTLCTDADKSVSFFN